jgi:RNA polymerase sigma factor (TIGR02999 family)
VEQAPHQDDGTPLRALLEAAGAGDPAAADRLFPQVYQRLRAIAQQHMGGERPSHTLQATALVHEAFVRLMGDGGARHAAQVGFYYAAAEAMRRILIEHARARGAHKRGSGRRAIDIEGVLDLAADQDPEEILAFDGAFQRLQESVPDAAAVVRLRFYAGLSVEQTAEALGVSPRTVDRSWAFARAWLFRELGGAGEDNRPAR